MPQELTGYLSSLEAEKLRTDMEISDYRYKLEALKKELQQSEYFDQAFLDTSR